MNRVPNPQKEFARIIALSEFDLDYTDLENNFKDLTKLAAKVAGTGISLVNLIDTFTQWSVANYGLELKQMPREESVCQFTILQDEPFEIKDLKADDRFKNQFYVKNHPNLKYYFGIPLQNAEGINLGALCVMDEETKQLTPEKIELLEIIADEIVNRLRSIKAISDLKNSMEEMRETHKKVAHDIRGPIGGIIGLAQLISEQGDQNKLEEVMEFIKLIQKSGKSVLELADEILTSNYKTVEKKSFSVNIGSGEINVLSDLNLQTLRQKLLDMYAPQAIQKQIDFEVINSGDSQEVGFPKNKLLQIIGNLISNAIKFTPSGGTVNVSLNLKVEEDSAELKIVVEDTGTGIAKDKIEEILKGGTISTNGTEGEIGYGFGLELVRHLIHILKGNFQIESFPGEGTKFTVILPMRAYKSDKEEIMV